MRFPSEFIERLRNHVPVSQVIGKRIAVKRHGREFHALCPFHKEKTPSFTINDEKGFFHCFGCSAHGDVIGFIKDYEGLTYIEAVERLAAEFGMQVPKMSRESEEFEHKRHTLENTVALAAEWFVKQLQTPAGSEARQYIEQRGLTKATIERFGIGYAPVVRDALKMELMKQGISEAMLIEAGLLAKSDDGMTYDRFRGRLIFPIRNARGAVVAFGGRILPSAQSKNLAKYLNSPETPIFKKGEMLFAYDIASRSARDNGSLIVAEGYMDVIALHQAGFTTAVAPLGTAITESQLKLLWRVSPEPVLCLDGDAAGARAMKRAAELALPLLKPGYSLKFATLPKGEDPDSFIKKSGVSAMRLTLERAGILSQVLWENALSETGAKTAEQKAMLEQSLMKAADTIADNVVKQHFRDYFRNQLFALKRDKKGIKPIQPSVPLRALPDANDDNVRIIQLEEQVITLTVLHPSIIHDLDIEEHLARMDFTQPVLDKLRSAVLEVSHITQSVDHASLCAALAERGFSEKVKTLLDSNTPSLQHMLGAKIVESPELASRAFGSLYSVYTRLQLDHDIREAGNAVEREPSESNQERFFALLKRRAELQNAYVTEE